jgi:hypothetical protein
VKTLILALVFIGFLIGCRAKHDHHSFYGTRSDAEKNGEFDRGWLPDFLPQSSHAIHLAYDLSPSEEWCGFEFDPADAKELLKNVKPVAASPTLRERVRNPNLQWWPGFFEGNLDLQKMRSAGFALYSTKRSVSQVEDETLLFAIDTTSGRGYFYGWETPAGK